MGGEAVICDIIICTADYSVPKAETKEILVEFQNDTQQPNNLMLLPSSRG